MLYTVALVSFFMAVGPALMVLNKEILDVVRSGGAPGLGRGDGTAGWPCACARSLRA